MHDDATIGQVLSRRQWVTVVGLSGAALLASSGWPGTVARAADCRTGCIARPAQSEGPFFVDGALERSDIRSDPYDGNIVSGMPLALTLVVSRWVGGECLPVPGAEVHLWQADARGLYSGVRDRRHDAREHAFLRGWQSADACGEARFLTVFPGWYPGRTIHVHFKIRTDPGEARSREFTSQLYFDEALTDRVHARPPYADRGTRNRRNADDGLFRRGGAELMLDVAETGDTLEARFPIGLVGI